MTYSEVTDSSEVLFFMMWSLCGLNFDRETIIRRTWKTDENIYRTLELNMWNNDFCVPVYCNIMCAETTVPNESDRTVQAIKSKKGIYLFIYGIAKYCKVGHPETTFVLLWEVIHQKFL